MDSFTFVTLSYNQEKIIQQHLESIKSIVSKYGNNINITYVLSDDCSKDSTIAVVMKWINRNPIFQTVIINQNSSNLGTVKNYIKALSLVETENFKILAGDDFYGVFNIFAMFENIDNSLFLTPVTPVTPLGKIDKNYLKFMEKDFRLLMYFREQSEIIDLIRISNIIPAPGTFYKLSLVKDENLFRFMSQFKFIEDYSMWYYLLSVKNVKTIIDNCSHIYYRIGNGITTNKTSKLRKEYLEDMERIKRIIKPKHDILPKYINPYLYYLEYLRLKAEHKKDDLPISFLPDPSM